MFNGLMGVNLYYYSHLRHKNYSDVKISSVLHFSIINGDEKSVHPCSDATHDSINQSYMPYVFDFAMLETVIPGNQVLEKIKQEVIGIESKLPPREDEWTERLAFGLKQIGISANILQASETILFDQVGHALFLKM